MGWTAGEILTAKEKNSEPDDTAIETFQTEAQKVKDKNK